jgi:nucleoside 2-deoxyribosyltransferase
LCKKKTNRKISIKKSDIVIFNLSTNNPNVIFELGLAVGSGAYVFLLRSRHYSINTKVLLDLNGILEYRYTRRNGHYNFDSDFKGALEKKIRLLVRKKRNKLNTYLI